jgi:hypothetical protein
MIVLRQNWIQRALASGITRVDLRTAVLVNWPKAHLAVFEFVPGDPGRDRLRPQCIQNEGPHGFRPPEFGPDRAIRCHLGCQSAQGR